MNYFLSTFLNHFSSFDTENIREYQITNIDDVDMFLVGLPWAINETTTSATFSQKIIHEGLQCTDVEKELQGELAKPQSYEKEFDVVTDDKDSDYNWNIRDDYEERDHVYYMPEGTYRSYAPYYWKNQADEARSDDLRMKRKDGLCERSNANSDDIDSNYSWKIRYDYEEHGCVYKVPSDEYKNYELGHWKKDYGPGKRAGGGKDESERKNSATKTQSNGTQSSENGSAGLTVLQITDYNPNAFGGNMDGRLLCRACGTFYIADGNKFATSQKKRAAFGKKILFWRKEQSIQQVHCGCRAAKKSLLMRIFGKGRRRRGC